MEAVRLEFVTGVRDHFIGSSFWAANRQGALVILEIIILNPDLVELNRRDRRTGRNVTQHDVCEAFHPAILDGYFSGEQPVPEPPYGVGYARPGYEFAVFDGYIFGSRDENRFGGCAREVNSADDATVA